MADALLIEDGLCKMMVVVGGGLERVRRDHDVFVRPRCGCFLLQHHADSVIVCKHFPHSCSKDSMLEKLEWGVCADVGVPHCCASVIEDCRFCISLRGPAW